MDVCAGANEEEKGNFDPEALSRFVHLISTNLTNPEQQIRTEANRLLGRLLELTEKTKMDLLASKLNYFKQKLLTGFIQFSSMSVGSQLGFLVCF